MDLKEVCYEPIKDKFYYGVYGDFKLVIDKDTGYFNATKLCDQGRKNCKKWLRLEKTKRMIDYYKKRTESTLKHDFLYEINCNNKEKVDKKFVGMYVPKEFILDIASWISIEFYDKCNNILGNYFIQEFKNNVSKTLVKCLPTELTLQSSTEVKAKSEQIIELQKIVVRVEKSNYKLEQYIRTLGISLEEVKDQNEELLTKTRGLTLQNSSIQRKLGIEIDTTILKPIKDSMRDRVILIKRNDPDYLPYYTVQARNSYIERKLKFEKLNFPNLEILLDSKQHSIKENKYTSFTS
jgi:hypothetical protein